MHQAPVVTGNPSSRKSTLIKSVAYVYSKLQKKNFHIFWIDTDYLPFNYIFGSDKQKGLLDFILDSCKLDEIGDIERIEGSEDGYGNMYYEYLNINSENK